VKPNPRWMLFFLLAVPLALADATESGAWRSLPAGTATVILGTGGDTGFIHPKGCQGRMGGALYRPAFGEWLREHEPAARPIWVSTGNLADPTTEGLASLEEMYAFLGTVPYAVAAVGHFDLDAVGAARLVDIARRSPVALVAANLQVLETGRPLLDEAIVLDTPSGRIGFVGVIAHDLTALWGGPRTGTVVTVDPRLVVPAIADRLHAEGARVVLLTNGGYTETAELLRAVPGIDAVIASNGSYINTSPEPGFAAPTLWVGLLGQRLARIALDREGRILEASAQNVEGAFPIDPLTGDPVPAPQSSGASR